MALLEVEDIHTYYGNIEALKGVSLNVEEGEIVTLIGSNGALAPGSEILQRLADRWLLYFGVLFILVVFFFPKGVLGTLREARSRQASEPARPPIRT